MKTQRIMPPTYLLISIIFMVSLHLLFPGKIVIPQLWNLLGVLPIIFGVTINLSADKTLHTARTTVRPFEKSSTLITNGIYRITRNPMYLGFILILLGIAILLRSLTPFVIIVAFAILMDKVYIIVEEQMLAEKFGASWKVYKENTRRWL